jgi:hypothetical protein
MRLWGLACCSCGRQQEERKGKTKRLFQLQEKMNHVQVIQMNQQSRFFDETHETRNRAFFSFFNK